MATLRDVAQVIRRVRQRLGVSQGALARRLNATNGTVQHWERGRTSLDLARLLALRDLCPRGRERTQLDTLIRQTQARVAPLAVGVVNGGVGKARTTPSPSGATVVSSSDEAGLMRLQRQVAKLHAILQEKNGQLRILQGRAADLYRELIALRASHADGPTTEIPNWPRVQK